MAPKLFVPSLVVAMLVTGVSNILLSKYQDQQCVRNCDDIDVDKRETFKQPVLQTAQMFIGEMGCWLAARGIALLSGRLTGPAGPRGYATVGTEDVDEAPVASTSPAVSATPLVSPWRAQHPHSETWRLLLLAIPTLLDICGTTLMNAGLLFTAPSVYQMTRGLVVLFVGCFSSVFLRRRLRLSQYLGIIGVVLGVAVVGLANVVYAAPPQDETIHGTYVSGGAPELNSATYTMIGILLIAGAQIFTASQLVTEEWLLAESSFQPIDVVGYEGVWGILLTSVIMIALYFTVGRTEAGRLGPLDIVEGWRQLTTVRSVLVSGVLVTISVGLFNMSGLAVTKHVSATSRSTIDSSRTILIWILSLSFGWETFKWLQAAGFILLLYSVLLFHGIVRLPSWFQQAEIDDE